MSSTIKVNTIQNASGGTPTASDLGLDVSGSVLQTVQTVVSTAVSVSAPDGTAASVSGFAATITPSSTSSKILVRSSLNFSASGTTYGGFYKRNGTTIGVGTAAGSQQEVGFPLGYIPSDANQSVTYSYEYLDSPASTSALTYQLWVNNDNYLGCYFNRSVNNNNNNTGKAAISTITLMEIGG